MRDVPKFKTFRDLRAIPKAAEKSSPSISSSPSIPSSSSPSNISSVSELKKQRTEVSPIRDFQKIPNSIPRNLNLFRGKSKQVWDYLWSISRGAINPSRMVRKSRKEIKEVARLGSMVTVDAAIKHLENVGLLKVVPNIGSLGGNEYEIFTPEEIESSSPSISSISSNTSLTQKVDDLDAPESSISSIIQTIENKATSDNAKTSFKDNTKNDDDAGANAGFSVMIERLDAAAKKLTGKGVSRREAEAWGSLADLLVLELEVAASRTGGVSSVPAFLTEVLRRQFFASRQQESSGKPAKTKTDAIGKSDPVSYEIKPLDKKGKEEALAQLREFANDDFLQDFKKWYMPEDWIWLEERLESDNQ